jgi:sarcosine oxidase subunit alpha
MRLEKGHFIVGQDTDGLTKLTACGLDRLIKLDKDDFVGRPELAWTLERAGTAGGHTGGDEMRLVALQPIDPTVVPAEACQIVGEGTTDIVGRITSSRHSPTLDRSICLGQVTASLAAPGTDVTVVLTNGNRVTATVMEHHAHLDPEGTRLRV